MAMVGNVSQKEYIPPMAMAITFSIESIVALVGFGMPWALYLMIGVVRGENIERR